MSELKIIYRDNIKCQVIGLTPEDRSKVYDHFSLFVPSARFTPKFKIGAWDGYIRYFTLTGQFYINLLPEMFKILDMSKYTIERVYDERVPQVPVFDEVDETYMEDVKWGKGHRLEGQPVVLFDHQIDIINNCLANPKGVVEACTGAGKTLVSAVLAKEVMKHGRFIIVEPSKDLTLQTAQTFIDLGINCGVCGCGRRELDKDVTICTWQTINSLERRKNNASLSDEKRVLSDDELNKLVNGTIGILFDEAHCCKSHQVKKMCETTFRYLPIRWGLTGTIPKVKADAYSLITGIGPLIHKLDSCVLQEAGILAQCDITCIKLNDLNQFLTYSDEVTYLSTNDERINFIGRLIANIVKDKGNTLVLVNRIVCGEKLEELLQSLGTNCIFLDGSVKSSDRFLQYDSIKTENNKCIIATSQIASTGLDIPRLFNLVFLDYGKSFVKTIQSIGRGLRLGKDKDHVDIFDISSTTPFSRKHLNDRIHYYDSKKFPFKVLDVEKWR